MKKLLLLSICFLAAISLFAEEEEYKDDDFIITQILVGGKPVFAGAKCYILRKDQSGEYEMASEGKDILRWRLHPDDKIEMANPDAEMVLKKGGSYLRLKMKNSDKIKWKVPFKNNSVDQEKGSIFYNDKESKDKISVNFGPKTKKKSISVKGTAFEVAEEGDNFFIKLIDGSIEIKDEKGKVIATIKPGEAIKCNYLDDKYEIVKLTSEEKNQLAEEAVKITKKTEDIYETGLSVIIDGKAVTHEYKTKTEIEYTKTSKVFKDDQEKQEYAAKLKGKTIEIKTGEDAWKSAVILAEMGTDGLKEAVNYFQVAKTKGIDKSLEPYFYAEYGEFLKEKLKDNEKSVAVLEEGYAKYSDNATIMSGLEIAYILSGKRDKAEYISKKLKEISEDDPDLYITNGGNAYTYGKMAIAEINYRKALSIITAKRTKFTKDDYLVVIWLSRALIALGGTQEARYILEKHYASLELENFNFMKIFFLNELGSIYSILGKSDKALDHYKQLLKNSENLAPDDLSSIDKSKCLSAGYRRLSEIYRELGETNKARDYFLQSFEISKKLFEDNPNNIDIILDLCLSADEFIQICLTEGTIIEKMLDPYKQIISIYEESSKLDPDNSDKTLKLSSSYVNLGDCYSQLGETSKSLDFYNKSFVANEKLYTKVPDNNHFAGMISMNYDRLGDIHLQLGESTKALDYYSRAFYINEKLYLTDNGNSSRAGGLSNSYNKLGNIYLQFCENEKALDFYSKSLNITEKLYQADTINSYKARGLCDGLNNLGDIYQKIGESSKSIDYYNKSFLIIEKLYKIDSVSSYNAGYLSVSYNKLGDAHLQLGETMKALDYYNKSFVICEELYNADSVNCSRAGGLSNSCNKLGHIYLQLGESMKALNCYSKSLNITEKLYQVDTVNSYKAGDLSYSYNNLGNIYLQIGENTKALDCYSKSLAISEKLYQADKCFNKLYNLLGDISSICISYVALENKAELENYQKYAKKLVNEFDSKNIDPQNLKSISDQIEGIEKAEANYNVTAGWQEILNGNFIKAENYCLKAVELNPNQYSGLVNAGHIYFFKDEIKKAREYYTKAIQAAEDEYTINAGIIADFKLFIEKGWKTEECKQEIEWVKSEWLKKTDK